MLDECFSYNDELRKNGHLVAEEPLQQPNTAVTVSWKNRKVAVTDGPFAETKEQLLGIQVLEARDLNHAIQLISQSPGVKLQCGTIEIRPTADISGMMRESKRRRAKENVAVRAATRERMISIMAEAGLAGGLVGQPEVGSARCQFWCQFVLGSGALCCISVLERLSQAIDLVSPCGSMLFGASTGPTSYVWCAFTRNHTLLIPSHGHQFVPGRICRLQCAPCDAHSPVASRSRDRVHVISR